MHMHLIIATKSIYKVSRLLDLSLALIFETTSYLSWLSSQLLDNSSLKTLPMGSQANSCLENPKLH